MKKKYNVTIFIFIFLVVMSFAIEEAIKDYEWFKQIIGMIKTLIENIGEIGLAVATILFVVRWVRISKEDIELRIKKLESENRQGNNSNDNNKGDFVKAEISTDKFKDVRFIIDTVRFSNYKQNDGHKNSDGMIRNFISNLKDEKTKVKELMINKYNYRAIEADTIINEYYSNYK